MCVRRMQGEPLKESILSLNITIVFIKYVLTIYERSNLYSLLFRSIYLFLDIFFEVKVTSQNTIIRKSVV